MAESVRQRVIPKVALPKVAPQPSVPKKDENVSSSQPPSVGPSATKVGETKSTGLAAHIGSKYVDGDHITLTVEANHQ